MVLQEILNEKSYLTEYPARIIHQMKDVALFTD